MKTAHISAHRVPGLSGINASKSSRDAMEAKHDTVAGIIKSAAPYCEIRSIGEFDEPEWVVKPQD